MAKRPRSPPHIAARRGRDAPVGWLSSRQTRPSRRRFWWRGTLRLGPEVEPRDDLYRDEESDDPVDRCAERRPPPGAGDELATLLPRVLEPMGREPKRKEP